jgi:hypothetical protein
LPAPNADEPEGKASMEGTAFERTKAIEDWTDCIESTAGNEAAGEIIEAETAADATDALPPLTETGQIVV